MIHSERIAKTFHSLQKNRSGTEKEDWKQLGNMSLASTESAFHLQTNRRILRGILSRPLRLGNSALDDTRLGMRKQFGNRSAEGSVALQKKLRHQDII